jgi:phenylalanyl-tRNA synthetase beta chain
MGFDSRFAYKKREDSTFIKGRSADILLDDEPVGLFGEVNPKVLSNLELGTPVVAFEIYLPRDGQW